MLAPLTRLVIAPAWAMWERSPYITYQRTLRKTQYDSPAVISQRQWDQIVKLMDHAHRTAPFWRTRLAQANLSPTGELTWDNFYRLPILTKLDLRANFEDMLSTEYAGATLHDKTTSGSTGISVRVVVDEAAQQFKRACALRSDEWTGWRLGERVAAVWGNPAYLKRGWRGRLRNALLERCTALDTLNMSEQMMEDFLTSMRRKPPSLLFGHAHSLYLFARFVETKGGPGVQVKAIIATAMVLHSWERDTIEKVFNCPVTNRYGCEEVSLIACECARHEGLHVNADSVFVEVVRADGTPAEPGELGMILVTDLRNRAMPIIRYQVGDMAVWAGRPCGCGRGLPLLERVEGRMADYVVTARGKLISGISLTENFAVLVPGLAQLQIIQEENDRLLLRIVRGSDFGQQSLDAIGSLVRERFGPEMNYECEFVERILPEASGKYRFCISKVPNPFTRPHSARSAETH